MLGYPDLQTCRLLKCQKSEDSFFRSKQVELTPSKRFRLGCGWCCVYFTFEDFLSKEPIFCPSKSIFQVFFFIKSIDNGVASCRFRGRVTLRSKPAARHHPKTLNFGFEVQRHAELVLTVIWDLPTGYSRGSSMRTLEYLLIKESRGVLFSLHFFVYSIEVSKPRDPNVSEAGGNAEVRDRFRMLLIKMTPSGYAKITNINRGCIFKWLFLLQSC